MWGEMCESVWGGCGEVRGEVWEGVLGCKGRREEM